MELLPVDSDAEWACLLDAQADATLFHTMPWLRFQERQFGFRLFPLVAWRDGQAMGVFPLFVTRRGLFRVSASPRGIDMLILGPLVAPEFLGELLDAYEDWARSRGIDHTSIAFTKEIDPAVAERHGYVCQRQRNGIVDLRGGTEAVYGRLAPECRRRVRRAEALGVRIVEGDLTPYLDRYLHLSAEVFARSGLKTPLTRGILSAMLEALRDAGCLLSIRAEAEGQVTGMWFGGHYNGRFQALNTVSDRSFAKYSMNNLMNWHAIRWCCQRGLRQFDFGGANIKSLAVFKGSFGAALSPYSNLVKTHSRLARAVVRIMDMTAHRFRAMRFRSSRQGRLQPGAHPHLEPQPAEPGPDGEG